MHNDPGIPDLSADADIDHDGPVTPYRQLAGIIVAKISRGDWGPGRAIASEANLVQTYGLARTTVRRSIRLLAEAGYVVVVPQRGTFVAS